MKYAKPLPLALIAALVLIIALLSPQITGWFESEVRKKISFAVEQAGEICLADKSSSQTDAITTNVTARLLSVSGQGRIRREEIRKSVDLAVGDAALMEERNRVSDCMDNQVTKLMAVQGLVQSTSMASVAPTDFPANTAKRPKIDPLCYANELKRLVGPSDINQPGRVDCDNAGISGRGKSAKKNVVLAAAPGFALIGSVDPRSVSNNDGNIGTPVYAQDANGHTVSATVEISCRSENKPYGAGAWMGIDFRGLQRRILALQPEEKTKLEISCPLS